VNIRSLIAQIDSILVLTAVMPVIKVSRATAISGGEILKKNGIDSAQSSDENVVCRAALMESQTITATPGNILWQQFSNRMHTAVEQQKTVDRFLLPKDLESAQTLKVRPGETLLVQLVSAATTSNPALSNNFIVKCMWEEDAISTFAISGTVTLSAVPVEGARVIVVEMDDVLGTNAHLREVIVTPAGGTWASTIRTGKVGAAFVQYKNGATYYTAPGSPYLS
jgi:hypothetical protein